MIFTLVVAFCLSLVGLSIQADAPSFSSVLSSNANLSSFSSNLNKYYPDLLTYIEAQTSDNPITVLAPSNAAFSKTVYYPVIGPAFSNNDVGTIQAILDYHVVSGNHPSTALLPTFQYFETHLTNTSYTNVTDGQRVGGVMQSGTIMVWTSGESNRSPVSVMDISFAGGTVHIIDSLLIPPTSFPATAELFSLTSEPYELTSFLGATYYTTNGTAPALAALLNDTTDVTIFAPNNAGMEKVAAALAGLATDLNSFDELLEYHIIVGNGGPWYSTLFNLTTGQTTSLKTLNGGDITISFSSNSYFVNGARILTSDLLLSNGVLHVLDNVLSPDAADATPNPSLATQVPALETGSVFNISSAPYTTWLPNSIDTRTPTPTGATYQGRSGNAASTATATGSRSAGETGSAKGGAGRVVDVGSGRDWLLWGSMGGAILVGGVAMFV